MEPFVSHFQSSFNQANKHKAATNLLLLLSSLKNMSLICTKNQTACQICFAKCLKGKGGKNKGEKRLDCDNLKACMFPGK